MNASATDAGGNAGGGNTGVNGSKDKSERRSTQPAGSGAVDLSEENVDAFYRKMLVRAPNKRQVR